MKKLIKLSAILLVALMAMPSTASAKGNNENNLKRNVAIAAHNAQQEVCKISGNDCKQVVTLIYEIFMLKDYKKGYIYDENDQLQVVEPYATQLKKMNITVEDMSRYRDGGTTFLTLGDNTKIYFDNNMGKATLDDPQVTLPDGRVFTLSRAEMEKTIEENLRISGNDCQKVVDLMHEIFVVKEAYNHQDNVSDRGWTENKNCKVLEPYASKLKKMNITVTGVFLFTSRGGAYVTQVNLGDGTSMQFVKEANGQYRETVSVDVGGYYSMKLPLTKGK